MKKLCYLFSINGNFSATIWEAQILLYNMIYMINIDPQDICCVIYNNNERVQSSLVQYLPKNINIIYGYDYSNIKIWRSYTDDGIKEDNYPVLNKSNSIGEFYNSKLYQQFENFLIIDADSFFFGYVDYSKYFGYTVLAYAPFIKMSCMFKEELGAVKKDAWNQDYNGINLHLLFQSINIPKNYSDLLIDNGTHHLIMPCNLLNQKFINDLNYWSIVCKTLCYIQGWNSWIPDMVTYPLALASNGIKFIVSNDKELSYCSKEKYGIVHYGFNYPFLNSQQFTKGMYYSDGASPMNHDLDYIETSITNAVSEVEKYFFNIVRSSKIMYNI